MNLLIAGGAGYLGSTLIPKLLDRGYAVDVVDLFWFGNNLPPEARILSKDIFALQAPDLEGYDQVIFLAGLSNDPMAEYAPSKNFIFNAAAPAFLAYLAKKAGVRRYVFKVDIVPLKSIAREPTSQLGQRDGRIDPFKRDDVKEM